MLAPVIEFQARDRLVGFAWTKLNVGIGRGMGVAVGRGVGEGEGVMVGVLETPAMVIATVDPAFAVAVIFKGLPETADTVPKSFCCEVCVDEFI